MNLFLFLTIWALTLSGLIGGQPEHGTAWVAAIFTAVLIGCAVMLIRLERVDGPKWAMTGFTVPARCLLWLGGAGFFSALDHDHLTEPLPTKK